ncbi:ankyrin repeats (3 copies) domain-containing protein [Ditylenchus destructor]|nr:ankyrin repeats (3 copies) domain-containing protein [Ditylenchus destructor]
MSNPTPKKGTAEEVPERIRFYKNTETSVQHNGFIYHKLGEELKMKGWKWHMHCLRQINGKKTCTGYIWTTGKWEKDEHKKEFQIGIVLAQHTHAPYQPEVIQRIGKSRVVESGEETCQASAEQFQPDAAPQSPIAQPDTPIAATPPHYPGLFEAPAQDPADAEDENERLRRELRELRVVNADLVVEIERQGEMHARALEDFEREKEELKEEREQAVEEVRALKRKLEVAESARRECEAKLARLLEGAAGPAEDLQRPGTSQGTAQPNQPGAQGRVGPQAAPADLDEDLEQNLLDRTHQADESIAAQNLLDRTHQADESMPALDLLNLTHQADDSAASSAEENARRLNPEEAARNLAEIRQMAREAPVRSFARGDPRIAAPIVMERHSVRIEPRDGPREQFMAAAKDDNLAELQRICAAHPELLQAQDPLKDNALHPAAHNNFVDVFEWLLSIGADPEFRTRDGWTPLHRAAHRANHQIIALLIQRGVKINSLANRKTPLHMAIESKENRAFVLETIKVLLAAPGINLHATSSKGETPLMLARRIDSDDQKIIKMIEKRLSSN